MNKARKIAIIIILIILVALLTLMIKGVFFSTQPIKEKNSNSNQEESLELIGEEKEPLEIRLN